MDMCLKGYGQITFPRFCVTHLLIQEMFMCQALILIQYRAQFNVRFPSWNLHNLHIIFHTYILHFRIHVVCSTFSLTRKFICPGDVLAQYIPLDTVHIPSVELNKGQMIYSKCVLYH